MTSHLQSEGKRVLFVMRYDLAENPPQVHVLKAWSLGWQNWDMWWTCRRWGLKGGSQVIGYMSCKGLWIPLVPHLCFVDYMQIACSAICSVMIYPLARDPKQLC